MQKVETILVKGVPCKIHLSVIVRNTNPWSSELTFVIIPLQPTSEKYRQSGKSPYKDNQFFMFFFDITNKKSFEDVPLWYQDVQSHRRGEFKVGILVGTKLVLQTRTTAQQVVANIYGRIAKQIVKLHPRKPKNLRISMVFSTLKSQQRKTRMCAR